MGSIIITHKRKSTIIISKFMVKWYIIRTVQAKSVLLKIQVEFQIGGKLWVPCFGKTWVPRSIHLISLGHRQAVGQRSGHGPSPQKPTTHKQRRCHSPSQKNKTRYSQSIQSQQIWLIVFLVLLLQQLHKATDYFNCIFQPQKKELKGSLHEVFYSLTFHLFLFKVVLPPFALH